MDVCTAAQADNLPMVVPGWEDSTMGNIFASYVIKGELKASTMKSGIEYMIFLADWYQEQLQKRYWVFSDRGRNSRGFSNLCSAYVGPGS